MKFCQSLKPIFISLSPNTERDDTLLALRLIFKPWKWKSGPAIKRLEEEFKRYLGVKYAFAFNNGRSAFLAILTSLNLKKESEVLLQAFTCNAAVNPILWTELKPVFVDCNKKTLNIDINDLKKKITPKSRVVIVQHTFGLPAEIEEVLKICQENNLILIEDCAHSLGATYQGKGVGLPTDLSAEALAKVEALVKVGTFGRAAFFSFGRDKIISSVHGGMAVTNDPFLAQGIKEFQQKINYPFCSWILQQILHPVLMNLVVLPAYNFLNLGKAILFVLQSFHVLSRASLAREKQGKKPSYLPKRLPNVLAVLALNQFKKLERFNQHRQKIAEFFDESLKDLGVVLPQNLAGRIYMRYSILFEGDRDRSNNILKKAQKENIFLDDGWREKPIVPPDTNQIKMGYVLGTCPGAEKVAKSIFNLPTHINISKKDAKRISDFLKNNL